MIPEEKKRLIQNREKNGVWHNWGPYLSERQWGTVREDYSENGNAWEYFSHDQSRSRAYRWGEDGIAGLSDEVSLLCFSVAMWNGKDPYLKERLYGLTNSEGNHGEDCKEIYYYLDNTPTHSYMKYLYRYPQNEYPYEKLVKENAKRTTYQAEYELLDTGIFDDDAYFDVYVEYAKKDHDDILIKITAVNKGTESAEITLLPQLWFRNTWSWNEKNTKSIIEQEDKNLVYAQYNPHACKKYDKYYSNYWLAFDKAKQILFTENETNHRKLYRSENESRCTKDAFHEYVVYGNKKAVNSQKCGSKVAGLYNKKLKPGESYTIKLRLSSGRKETPFGKDFEKTFKDRIKEADHFYDNISQNLNSEQKMIQRQAFAGLLWNKQYFEYDVKRWMEGDKLTPKPPVERERGRNKQWIHFESHYVLSMPDKWEYPWFAAWDLAFHSVSIAHMDPEFAKKQLTVLLRENMMHPNGQIAAYEWSFDDVNPPVHAWAAYRVFQIDYEHNGVKDYKFLEQVFHKMLMNFTWWLNRIDKQNKNIFQGGFLGLDNISVFDRSQMMHEGVEIEQSDATSWMGMFCLNMLSIALELAVYDRVYQDVAVKFLQHFLLIAKSMNGYQSRKFNLWDDEDGFYYDAINTEFNGPQHIKVRSLVGLIPLLSVAVFDQELLDKLPEFKAQLNWYLKYRNDLVNDVDFNYSVGSKDKILLSLVPYWRIVRLLNVMLDENEFLSRYGIRSLSKYHKDNPYSIMFKNQKYSIQYEPAESNVGLFGGNSNWRGPIWFPLNYLLIDSLRTYSSYYGDQFLVELPTGSGDIKNLDEIVENLTRRLIAIFQLNKGGKKPVFGGKNKFQEDKDWHDKILFYEYYHGDNGAGIGASHQTGWSALVANLIHELKKEKRRAQYTLSSLDKKDSAA